MIEMTDKRIPPVEVRIKKNRIEIIVLKCAPKGTDIGGRCGYTEKSA